MNDTDIDQRLREYGATWREANNTRPGIDWDSVTRASRSKAWLGVAAVAAVVAAVAISLLVVAIGGGSDRSPLSPAAARRGAPDHFFAIVGGKPSYVQAVSTSGPLGYSANSDLDQAARSLGVSVDDKVAYAAYPGGGCSTVLQRHTAAGVLTVTTIDGQVARTAMAVSPNGRQLAFVVDAAKAGGRCRPVKRLEVLDLGSHQLRTWSASINESITALSWSTVNARAPLSVQPQLAFQVGDLCQVRACQALGSQPAMAELGTHVLNLDIAGNDLDAAPRILPPVALPNTGADFAPVFWWHGGWVTITGGELRPVHNGGLASAQEHGFPKTVYAVSSDRTGNHLLIVAGSLHGFVLPGHRAVASVYAENQAAVETGEIYRWDRGRLARMPGTWAQPGW